MTRSYDLVVIGTGIIGAAAVALAGARDDGATIAAVCAGTLYDGATTCSLAVDLPAGQSAAERDLVMRSEELSPLVGVLAPSWRRRRYDSFWLAAADQISEIEEQLVGDRVVACDARDRAVLHAAFGRRLGARGSVLLRSGTASGSDAAATVRELLATLSVRPGSALIEGFAVDQIAETPEGYVLSTADGRRIVGRSVLAAPGTGAMSGPFRSTAQQHGARTKKIVAFELRAPFRAMRPLLNLEEHQAFLVPRRPADAWCLSVTSNDWDCGSDRSALRADAEDWALAERALAEALPDFPVTPRGSRVGADIYLPERHPLVVPLDQHDRVVLAAGGAGSGFRLAPGIADQALDLIGFRDHKQRACRAPAGLRPS